MTPAEVLTAARASGVTLWAEGDALRYRGPRKALTAELLDQLKVHKPAILAALARPELSGVSPEFAARLSSEDLAELEVGDLQLPTVHAFEAAAIAREARDLRAFFEERAGILEHDAGLPRPEAELDAAWITATLAQNRGYLWASLRSALADYPALLTQMPDTPGPIDSIPFGMPRSTCTRTAPCSSRGRSPTHTTLRPKRR